jgi:hypothetical protein
MRKEEDWEDVQYFLPFKTAVFLSQKNYYIFVLSTAKLKQQESRGEPH